MKTMHFVIAGILGVSAAVAAEPPPSPTTAVAGAESGSHERVELKVLRVLSAKDGDAVFRAYLVEWQGQVVAVEDPLAQTHHRVGETIGVLIMKHPYPKEKETHGLLHFIVTM